MQIENSHIIMASTHTLMKRDERSEQLRIWVGDRDAQSAGPIAQLSERPRDRVSLTHKAKTSLSKKHAPSGVKERDVDIEADSKLFIIKLLVEKMTGKKIRLLDTSELQTDPEQNDMEDINPQSEEIHLEGQNTERAGWGIEYDYHESHYEHEDISFVAEGVIKTKDGKEINFSLNLNISREFMSEENISFRAGDAVRVDPLVINFEGSAAELTSTEFTFDLDSDGEDENIPFVSSGSGLLVLDMNNDGKINNGKELFGPSTGNGFVELAAYDEDGNNWIDENESAYARLSVWTKDSEGNNILSSLREKGVGAIYLASIDSQFDLKDSNNNLNGKLNRSGIYLYENGTAGTVQQIDMVV